MDPFVVLDLWLKRALKIPNVKEPWAMVLSTSYRGEISSRVLLLKQYYPGKLLFYTNYLSKKGRDIEEHSRASANFYWPSLGRQIRIEGRIKKTSRRQSLSYWKTRDRLSQISQWISSQSQPLSSRKKLEQLKQSAEKKFYKKEVPCPLHWGGYILFVQKIEFWRERPHRLHDRFLFKKTGRNWKKQRLFP